MAESLAQRERLDDSSFLFVVMPNAAMVGRIRVPRDGSGARDHTTDDQVGNGQAIGRLEVRQVNLDDVCPAG